MHVQPLLICQPARCNDISVSLLCCILLYLILLPFLIFVILFHFLQDYPCFEGKSVSLQCNEECKKILMKTEKERKEQERIQQEEEMKLHQV